MPSNLRTYLSISLTLLIILSSFNTYANNKEKKHNFPIYPVIKDNVIFWEKVYSIYNENQAIIHDRDNLNLIYDVVNLVDPDTPGARLINEKIVSYSKNKYQRILRNFATGSRPKNKTEQRIYSLLQANKINNLSKLQENIRMQRGQKDKFIKGVIRSGAYLPRFKEIFRSYGLPEELAYLPHVESSFNLYAHSHAGAAGMWQFTKGTGKDFMLINDTVDERLDPFIAADAAARLLRRNYQVLENWPATLTSYNYGRAGMIRAMKKYHRYENIFKHYDEGIFGFAARNFYPSFVAAYRTAKRLEAEPQIIIDKPEKIFTIKVQGYTNFKQIADWFEINPKELSRLNPALTRVVLAGKRLIPAGYILRLPDKQLVRTKAQNIPEEIYRPEQIRNKIYRVKKGDSLSKIARKHGVSKKSLARENKLESNSMIKIGQKLLIPSHNQPEDVIVIDKQYKIKP